MWLASCAVDVLIGNTSDSTDANSTDANSTDANDVNRQASNNSYIHM